MIAKATFSLILDIPDRAQGVIRRNEGIRGGVDIHLRQFPVRAAHPFILGFQDVMRDIVPDKQSLNQ